MNTLRFVSIVFVATLAACSQTNQSHCANREGDQTCAQQDAGSHPQCSSCESANNGCVEASVELMGSCHAETVADTSTSNGSDPTTDDSVSSTTMTTNPTTTTTTDPTTTTTTTDPVTTDPVTTMTTSEDTTMSVSTTDETETTEGETTSSSSSTDPSETMESSTTMTDEVLCPNGVIDEGEQCDGEDLAGQTCLSQELGAGNLACSNQCQFDTSDCLPPAGCGDGTINGDEACDQDELGVTECMELDSVYGDGELGCNENCTYDTSNCCVAGLIACNGQTNCCNGPCFALLCPP